MKENQIMKLIFSGNTAWSMYNFRRQIFQHCINKGHKVYVIAPQDNIFDNKLRAMGCQFIPVQLKRKGTNPLQDIKLCREYYRIFKQIHPDGCFSYTIKPNIYGSIAASMLHIPYIPITTGLGYIFNTKSLVSIIAKGLYKIAFKKAPQVWFLNQEDINSFVSNQIIPASKAQLLRGEGIDLSHFIINDKEEDGKISFILIARMLWDKGVGIFVDAAKLLKTKYPNVDFLLLGKIDTNNPMGIPQSKLEEWDKQNIIKFLGETEDVRPYINRSTCVVLPSFYREGIPLCLMEGAASGKPIITTNNTGCKEVVEDGYNGFLCKTRNVESLVSAMEKIIKLSPEERKQMGRNGRKKMQKEFDMNLIVKEYDNAITKFENK